MMTEEEFRAKVAEEREGGLEAIDAVYKVMDEAQAADPRRWACHRGCSLCCHQMIMVTSVEADAIVTHLKGMERKKRRRILAPMLKSIRRYWAWFMRNGGANNPAMQTQMTVKSVWDGKACPFLDKQGACSIHPARPLSCRAMHSTTICQKLDWPDAVPMPSDAAHAANLMILEMERSRGVPGVAPMQHWLKLKEKEL